MRIIVTGGYGFIGSTLIKRLIIDKKNIVLNIDAKKINSMPESLAKIKNFKNYKFKKLNIDNYKKLNNLILEFKPNLVFHLAAESHVDNSITSPKDFIYSNIVGTFNLLDILSKYIKIHKKISNKFRLIHVSTDEVYGSLTPKEKSFKEDNKFYPNSPYSASKASGDLLCRAWNKTFKLPIITTNCSNNYGPWQFPEKLIPLVIKRALQQKKIPIYGTGKNIRDWIHVDDHVSALIKLSKKGKIGETYNIGGDNEITNISLVRKICDIIDNRTKAKISSKKLISFVTDRAAHDFRYSINSKKLENEINFKAIFSIHNGIYQTVNWYLDNKEWLLKK
jgi:dTDP-glucose 4,6-dehydratase